MPGSRLSARRAALLLNLLDVTFLICLLVLPFAWILDPLKLGAGPLRLSVRWGLKPLLAPVLCLFCRSVFKAWVKDLPAVGLLDRYLSRKIVLSLASVYLFVGLIEFTLMVIRFEIPMVPVVFTVKSGEGVTKSTDGHQDPELLWKLTPGETYYEMPINSLGFRDREVSRQKAAGTVRIICMGDSCTAHGFPPYSQLLNTILASSPPTGSAWESFNMAVYGYSAIQGLRLFQLQGKALQPDIVTLYFGWNDHWLNDRTDAANMAIRMSSVSGHLYELLKKKRLFMLLVKLGNRKRHFGRITRGPVPRVPPDEYRTALAHFVLEIRSVGATPLLITAPRRDANTFKGENDFMGLKVDFNTVHDQYAEITRAVATQFDADLLDLHAMYQSREFDGLFNEDGIHLNQAGLQDAAAEIDRKLRSMVETKRVGAVLQTGPVRGYFQPDIVNGCLPLITGD